MKKLVLGCVVAFLAAALVIMFWPMGGSSTLSKRDTKKLARVEDNLNRYHGTSLSYHKNRLRDAGNDIVQLVEKYPENSPVNFQLARFYLIYSGAVGDKEFSENTTKKTFDILDDIIKRDPGFDQAYILRATLYYADENLEKAKAELAKAEKLGTTDPWFDLIWAGMLVDESTAEHDDAKHVQAMEYYQKAYENPKGSVRSRDTALWGMNHYYGNHDATDKAVSMLKKIIENEPDHPWTYMNYASYVLCWQDDYETSIKYSRQGLEIMNYPMGNKWLAAGLYRKWADIIYHMLPRTDQKVQAAKDIYAEAQSLYSDVADVITTKQCPAMDFVQTMMLSEGIALPKFKSDPEQKPQPKPDPQKTDRDKQKPL
jgi:tetratricopeptide (TPR) repeat protein